MVRIAPHIVTLVFLVACGATKTDDRQPRTPGQDKTDNSSPKPVDPTKPTGPVPDNDPTNPGSGTTDPVASGLAQIKQPVMQQEVEHLASATFEGRGTGAPGNQAAADYLADQYESLGLKPGMGASYFQPFTTQSGATQNVVGIFEGTDPTLKNEVVIIGAHLDHLGRSGNTIYFGADDNASGTVTVLNVAKALAAVRSSLKRTVVVMGFSAEELGLLGSQHYVENPIFPMNRTVFMINLDMVGYGNGAVEALGVSTASARSHLDRIQTKYPALQLKFGPDPGARSDHAPFAQAGIPVALFHTGLHANYHKATDTVEKIDYASLANIARVTFELLLSLATDGAAGFDAREFYDRKASSFALNTFNFADYFSYYGIGHEPTNSSADNAVLPGQPL